MRGAAAAARRVLTVRRFAGFFALPQLAGDAAAFNASRALVVPVIERALRRMQADESLDGVPWVPFDTPPDERAQCEYVFYAQIRPVAPPGGDITADGLRAIEAELRFPTGQTMPRTPPLEMSALIYSPNCGFVLAAPQLRGVKVEVFDSQAAHLGLGAAAVAAAQIWLLIRQMNESNTLSTVSRVSFWTIAMMWMVDGYFFFSLLFIAMFIPACFLPIAAGSFCYLIITAQFGIRFLVATYRVHRQSRAVAPAAPPPTDAGLPTQEAPVIIPANQAARDDDANYDVGILQIRFYFALMVLLLFTINVTTWPAAMREAMVVATLLAANSYWLPQVWRNVMRGCRKAFNWEFVFGTSALRLAPVVYLYGYEDNIFKLARSTPMMALAAGWVGAQVAMLLAQNVLGPRFLLPADWLPAAYDYHPALGVDDEEAAQDIGTRTESGGRSFDCVVCMQTVEIPRAGGEEGVGLLGRRGYMVTPCKHVFHSHCLEGWMRFRLQCPICRNPLPAL